MNRMINIPNENSSYLNTDRHTRITEKLCSVFSLHMCKVYVSCFNYGNFQYVMLTIAGFKEHLITFHSVLVAELLYIFEYTSVRPLEMV